MQAIALILMAISLDLKDASLVDAFKEIEQQSGLQLAYEQKVVENAEPVTLKVEGVPAGEVLHRILRPRGLEYIQTSDTMAAIVRAESDMGMAKMAGRAIRTFARLAKKLEAAEQHGDEVTVPGWTDADDRALAEGIVDFASAFFYFDMEDRSDEETTARRAEDIARMITCYDKDVRAGVAVALEARSVQGGPPEAVQRLKYAVTAMLNDRDPVLRGCGLFSLLRLQRVFGEEWLPAIGKAAAVAAEDPAEEARFAAALVAGFNRSIESRESILETLRDDENAAIRFMAWALWFERASRSAEPEAAHEATARLLADKDPIVRPIALLFAAAVWNREPDRLREVLKRLDPAKDPWLKLSVDAFLPLFETEDPDIFAPVVTLATSNKRSHQALGAGLAAAGSMMSQRSRRPNDAAELPDLAPIKKLSASPYLWARVIGIMANGIFPDAAPEEQLVKALESDDEIDRLVALLVCSALLRRETGPSEILQENIRRMIGKGTFAERALACATVAKALPFDEFLELVMEQAKRAPRSVFTKILQQSLRRTPIGGRNEDDRKQQQMMALDAVLETKDAGLQKQFARQASNWAHQNPAILLPMIYDSEPEAFCFLLTNSNYRFHFQTKEFAPRAAVERIRMMSDNADPKIRIFAPKAMAGLLSNSTHLFIRYPDLKEGMISCTRVMLDACFTEGASDEEIAAGFTLLKAIVGRSGPMASGQLKWADIPADARNAAVQALGYANDKTHGPAVALLLCSMFETGERAGINDCPALVDAMDAARGKIMEKGTPEDQIVVLRAEAMGGDEAVYRPAVAELEQRLMNGAVPIDLQKEVLIPFRKHSQLLSADFKEYLIRRLSDPEEPVAVRSEALRVLRRCPDQVGALIDTLTEVAKAERPTFDFASELRYFVKNEIRRLKKEDEPLPEWVDKAAALGLMLVNDKKQWWGLRRGAVRLYVAAAGTKASDKIEAIILDEKENVQVRAAAARELANADPETKLFGTLMKMYDALPREVVKGIAESAGHAPRATGAEAFVIHFLEDAANDRGNERFRVLFNELELPLTPKLRACLEGLKDDPRLGHNIPNAIRRLEQKQQEQQQ